MRRERSRSAKPQYSQKAASHDGNDYGSTYVEINLTAQHLYFYKGGSLVVQSDFVSGNESKGWSTPAGAYPLTYKQRNATLKGENYSTPVSYWMPFNGGIGLHDAYWRSSFGGTIYKTNGSHGCINLPPAVAKTIYENISAGTAVLCYH
ncbi:MAG: L,D-transpeptidase [Lachnospiraceae bacterium]